MLDDTGYAAIEPDTANPSFASQYCNGSRVPPTCTVADGCGGPSGYGVPPGIVDASAPNPVFSLTPNATVDEGNNWINVSWGPLALSDDSVTGGANGQLRWREPVWQLCPERGFAGHRLRSAEFNHSSHSNRSDSCHRLLRKSAARPG